ncbi:MAG: uroporphyrinogen-III synthase [Vulcanimicrobiaceae bacterium]
MANAPIVLLPRTRSKPSQLAVLLRDLGANVVEVSSPGDIACRPQIVLIPAAAAVEIALPTLRALSTRPIILAMGPRSAASAEAAGYKPDAVAAEPTLEAFAALVGEYLAQ